MAKKKETTQKSLKETAKKKKGIVENVEKRGGNQQKKDNPYKNNGGARPGAGRKKNEDKERLIRLKDMAEEFALGEVEVKRIDKTSVVKVKLTRAEALLEVLFTEGLKNKNIPAIKEFFDRTRGRSRLPVEHSGEIKTEDQYIPTGSAIEKAHEVFKREQKKMLAQRIYDEEE